MSQLRYRFIISSLENIFIVPLQSTFYCVVAGLMFFTTLKTVIQAAFFVPQYMKGVSKEHLTVSQMLTIVSFWA